MSGLTDERAWWEPRKQRRLADLTTGELTALAAGMELCLEPALGVQADELLRKVKTELEARGNPLVTR